MQLTYFNLQTNEQQHSQCTYNVTFGGVRATTVLVEKLCVLYILGVCFVP